MKTIAHPYAKGRAREQRARHLLQELGWLVVRAAGSKGSADLVAWSPTSLCWFVQVKGVGQGVYGADRARWFSDCAQAAAWPVLVRPDRLGHLQWAVWRADTGRWDPTHPARWGEVTP